MTITCYTYTGEPNRLNKSAGLTATGDAFSAAAVGPVDVVRPTLLVNGVIPANCNYVEVSDFARWYWVDEITQDTDTQSILQLRSDPLYSFYGSIIQCPAIAARTGGERWSPWFQDPRFALTQRKQIRCKDLGSIGEDDALILAWIE